MFQCCTAGVSCQRGLCLPNCVPVGQTCVNIAGESTGPVSISLHNCSISVDETEDMNVQPFLCGATPA